MAKDYGKRNSARQNRGSVSKQLLLILVCFLCGYLSASFFDYTTISNWVNTQLAQQGVVIPTKPAVKEAQLPKPKFEFYTLLANENNNPTAPTSNGAVTAAPSNTTAAINTASKTQTPTSTMAKAGTTSTSVNPGNLAATKTLAVAASAATLEVSKQTVPKAVADKGNYLVQVAAFKSRQEAERMKGSLVLKGFEVSILTVTQQNMSWYRVNIGPFPSKVLAQKAQGEIARREHIVGMIRRMDA